MTEHDRGAYTPQPDAPLQFDARGPQRRKPMPMTLIGSGVVLVVLLGALALHARHDAKDGAEPVRPVGPPTAEVKAAPVAAQPKEAAAVDVFGGAASNTAKTPTFAPPPETPKPRAQLTVQTAEATPIKAAPLATTSTPTPAPAVGKAPALPVKTAQASSVPAYHAPTTGPVATTAPRPDATAVVARLAATPTLKATSVFGGSVVQIGAFSSMALSEKGWTDVSSAMAGEMPGKLKRVEAVEKDGKTFYRTSVAGFASRTAAEAFCRALTAKGYACFAKG